MPTVIDLGQAQKKAHPGAYDDIDDAVLGRAVQSKYPGQYEDFTNVNTGVRMGTASPVAIRSGMQSPAPSPTWLDRISTELNQGGAMLDPRQVINGIGSSLGRTTQAWTDALTGHPKNDTGPEMIPLIGPMAVDAVHKMMTPGQRLEGLTDAALMLTGDKLLPGPRDIVPGYNEGSPVSPEAVSYATARAKNAATTTGAVVKGAARGAAKEAMKPVPVGRGAFAKLIGVPEANLPAIVARPVQGFGAGEAVGAPLGAPAAGGAVGAAAGAMTPIVKGAYQGGRQALKDLRSHQEYLANIRDQLAPVYSDTPDLSYQPLTPAERQPTPDELAFDQAPRTQVQSVPPTPDEPPPPPAPPAPAASNLPDLSYKPLTPVERTPTPDEIAFEEAPRTQIQSTLPDLTAESPAPTPPAPANWTGNSGSLAFGGPQVPIVDISGRLPGPAAQSSTNPITPAGEAPAVAPDLTAASPLEQAQARQTHLESSGQAVPGTKILKVVPGEANTQAEVAQRADGQYAVVHRDLDSGEVVSTTITPDRAKAEAIASSIQLPGASTGLAPDLGPGNGTENTSGLLKDLTTVVKGSETPNAERVAERAGIVQHNNTAAKNTKIGQFLLDNNITSDQWNPLTMAEKNAWLEKLNQRNWDALSDIEKRNIAKVKGNLPKTYPKNKAGYIKPFGSDYDPNAEGLQGVGRSGRPAELAASDIGEALDDLWAKKKSSSGAITPVQPPALEPVQPTAAPTLEQQLRASVDAANAKKSPVPPAAPALEPAPLQRPFLGAKRPPAVPEIAQLANDYNATQGKPPVAHVAPEDPSSYFARYTADAYDKLKADNSADPTVRAAYDALAKEVNAQWDFAKANGITMEPWTKPGQPYANSAEMVNDLAKNKHLYFFQGGEPHPLLGAVDPETGLSANDKFRAVHDIFGHAAGGYGFGPTGEEAAYKAHFQMFSPEAARAMATETRGQNSWVNFGKQNYENDIRKNIPLPERPYAEQKADLLPPEFIPPDAQARRVSFGLDTGEGTPFRHEGITTINPKTADWALRQVAAKYGVGIMSEDIGRGAYLKSTEPAMHFEIVGAPKNIMDFMTAGGHALQQTEVIGTRALKTGKSYAFDIIQKAGKDLASDVERDAVFHHIRAELGDDADLIPGYQSIEKNGEPGVRFLKFDGRMTPEEISKIETAVKAVGEQKAYDMDTNHFPVDLLSVSNDWRVNPNGEGYTSRLTGSGQGPGRLMDDQFWRTLGSRIEADRAAGLTGQPASDGKPR